MMRRAFLSIFFATFAQIAFAQQALIAPNVPNGDSSDRICNTKCLQDAFAGGSHPALTNDHIFIGNGSVAVDVPMAGDCSISYLSAQGQIICGKTNGVSFGSMATQNVTAGGDLTGSWPTPSLAAIGAAAGPIGDASHTPAVTIDTKGRVTAVSSIALPIVGSCGWRQNMQMAPQDYLGTAGSETTNKTLTGPAYFVLCKGSSWIPASGSDLANTAAMVASVGQGGTGQNTGLVGINVTNHDGSGCVSPCVSTTSTQGGLDPGDPAGATLAANTLYHIFIVARDPSNAPNDWGLIFSSRGCTSGPSSTVQAIYPYYACIDWFWSNAAANAMAWETVKQDHIWNFAGGSGGAGANYPQIASGTTTGAWSAVFSNPATVTYGASDNSGTFTFLVGALTAGTYARIAPNMNFGTNPSCGNLGTGTAFYTFSQCTLTPDQGASGYESTDASGLVFLQGGVDGF